MKYVRDDRFVARICSTRRTARLDHAWNDLYASFEYHDNYLRMLAKHFKYDLKGKRIAQLDRPRSRRCRPRCGRMSIRCCPNIRRRRRRSCRGRPGTSKIVLSLPAAPGVVRSPSRKAEPASLLRQDNHRRERSSKSHPRAAGAHPDRAAVPLSRGAGECRRAGPIQNAVNAAGPQAAHELGDGQPAQLLPVGLDSR